MTETLSIAEFRAKYVRWCNTCAQETMPLNSGLCAFCLNLPHLVVDEEPEDTRPRCEMCGTLVEQPDNPGKFRRRFCGPCGPIRKREWQNEQRRLYGRKSERRAAA